MSLILNLIVFLEPYYPIIKPDAKADSRLYEPTYHLASVAKSQLDLYFQPDTTDETETTNETK